MTDEHDPSSEPVDLSSLDPRGEATHMNVLIDRIVADAMAARRSRTRSETLSEQLTRWSRPALLAASLVLAVALPVAVRAGRELSRRAADAAPPAPVALDSRLGLPLPVVELTQSGRSPTAADIAAAFDAAWTERSR